MKNIKQTLHRGLSVLSAISLLVMIVAPNAVYAASGSQVQNRSLTLGTSEAGATGTYAFQFDIQSTSNVGSIAFQVCDDPFPETECINTGGSSGIDMSGATLNSQTVPDGNGNFTIDGAQTSANEIVITRTAAATVNGTYSFTFGNVVNPSATNTTFYSRVTTHPTTTADNDPSSVDGDGSDAIDYGGLAVSTANTLTVTAKVQEQLTFCVYTNADCGSGGDSISLGDANGVLSSSVAYTDANTKFDLSTNASNGVSVTFEGPTLTDGANTIDAIGGTETASSPGTETEQFGFRISSITAGSTGTLTATEPYDGTADSNYGYDLAAQPDEIASSTGVIDTKTATLEFLGNISATTEAGIYTTTMHFVATGTF